MNKIIKEPLLHFLLLGILLYMASLVFSNDNEKGSIVVTQGKIKQLTTLYTKTWQRSPTPKELNEIIQEYVLEQAAYLEGVNLGLDKNDIVITRRVRQKLDFIAEESTPRPTATDDVLVTYLTANADKFRLEPTFSFKQVFLDPKNYNNAAANISVAANTILNQLTANPTQDISNLGDRYLFKDNYQLQSLSHLKSRFGKSFTQSLDNAESGFWFGPIRSSFGSHLVYIETKEQGKLPELAQIRSIVEREWENQLRNESIKQYYDALLNRYVVTIQQPQGNDMRLTTQAGS